MPRDWVDLPSPSSHFQDSVSCLTSSQDSQLLRHPAIDIAWRWPCLPRFRLLLRCAWWSLSLGWFLNLSLQRMTVMTFLTWTLDLSVLDTPPGYWLWHQHPCMCLCCLVSLFPVMLLPAYNTSTSRHPWKWYESCYVCVQVMYLLDMLFLL